MLSIYCAQFSGIEKKLSSLSCPLFNSIKHWGLTTSSVNLANVGTLKFEELSPSVLEQFQYQKPSEQRKNGVH